MSALTKREQKDTHQWACSRLPSCGCNVAALYIEMTDGNQLQAMMSTAWTPAWAPSCLMGHCSKSEKCWWVWWVMHEMGTAFVAFSTIFFFQKKKKTPCDEGLEKEHCGKQMEWKTKGQLAVTTSILVLNIILYYKCFTVSCVVFM